MGGKKYGDRGLLVKDSIGGNIFPMLRFWIEGMDVESGESSTHF